MTQSDTLKLKLSNSKVHKWKSGIKNGTKVTLNLSLKVMGNSNDECNFSHKWLLINTQISRFRKTFWNNSSANTEWSKTQLQKIGQSGWFVGRITKN